MQLVDAYSRFLVKEFTSGSIKKCKTESYLPTSHPPYQSQPFYSPNHPGLWEHLSVLSKSAIGAHKQRHVGDQWISFDAASISLDNQLL